MDRLALFINKATGEEFVVIVSEGEKMDDYAQDGYELHKVLDIDGDATEFPCDRVLRPE